MAATPDAPVEVGVAQPEDSACGQLSAKLCEPLPMKCEDIRALFSEARLTEADCRFGLGSAPAIEDGPVDGCDDADSLGCDEADGDAEAPAIIV